MCVKDGNASLVLDHDEHLADAEADLRIDPGVLVIDVEGIREGGDKKLADVYEYLTLGDDERRLEECGVHVFDDGVPPPVEPEDLLELHPLEDGEIKINGETIDIGQLFSMSAKELIAMSRRLHLVLVIKDGRFFILCQKEENRVLYRSGNGVMMANLVVLEAPREIAWTAVA